MHFLGIMSGTSLDGMDAALIDDAPPGGPTLIAHTHLPYPDDLAQRLRAITAESPLGTVLSLDAALPAHYARLTERTLQQAGIEASAVRAIGLHGQTVWHDPRAMPAVTCQIGDPSRLAEATGITVVAGFRQRDMAAGGEGAPLAPAFHSALFATDAPRAVINLGGIANITLLEAHGAIAGGFDCGPANTLLDAWARRHRGVPFDEEGQWAATGTVDPRLLEAWMAAPYFAAPPPKSTGPERFNLDWAETALQGGERPEDVQASLAELTARAIGEAVARSHPVPADVVVCGGGVHNRDLLERIRRAVAGRPLKTAESLGYPSAAIEAMGFAWLARAAVRGDALDLQPVTGARHAVPLGGIYPA